MSENAYDDEYTPVPPDDYLDLDREHRPLVKLWLTGDLETPTTRTVHRKARSYTETLSAHRTVELQVQVPPTALDGQDGLVELCQAVARTLYRKLAQDWPPTP